MEYSKRPVPEAGPPRTQPPAARQVPADSFFQATRIAWEHLRPAERKALRTTCHTGRLQHDGLLSELRFTLGCGGSPEEDGNDKEGHEGEKAEPECPPSPSQLQTAIQGALSRGARPQSLTLWFSNRRDEQRRAQLLAALAACSGCPLTRLELHGAVPLSEAVAEAVHACCPQLASLCLDHQTLLPAYVFRGAKPDGGPEAYHHGCVRLLELCGPRIRCLQLRGVYGWRTMSYMALRHCTALTQLEMEAGFRSCKDLSVERYTVHTTSEADVLQTVAQLTALRSLHLTLDPLLHSPEYTASQADSVARLSALTALTRLQLLLPESHEHTGERWHKQQLEGASMEAWRTAREAHRTSLLSALRAMPQLQHLHCPTLWLLPGELAALNAATSLTLAGLLPSATGRQAQQAQQVQRDGASGTNTTATALPPQLQELVLLDGASPRALAQLQQPLPSRARVRVPVVRFGTSDVTLEGRLTADAVAAVGPAVQLLLACGGEEVCVASDGFVDYVLPREGAADGHAEWIRQLRGLDAMSRVELEGFALRTGDLCCLGETLPDLSFLRLETCTFPVAALSGLRPAMRQLRRLTVDMQCLEGLARNELEAALLLLCRPYAGAEPVGLLQCCCCPDTVDVDEIQRAVADQLREYFGVRSTDVTFSLAWE